MAEIEDAGKVVVDLDVITADLRAELDATSSEGGVIGPPAQKNWIRRRRDHVQESQNWATDEF